jgi:hypothetical protein
MFKKFIGLEYSPKKDRMIQVSSDRTANIDHAVLRPVFYPVKTDKFGQINFNSFKLEEPLPKGIVFEVAGDGLSFSVAGKARSFGKDINFICRQPSFLEAGMRLNVDVNGFKYLDSRPPLLRIEFNHQVLQQSATSWECFDVTSRKTNAINIRYYQITKAIVNKLDRQASFFSFGLSTDYFYGRGLTVSAWLD